jgi:cytochrome oxidase Cu insertion factor (SCO1/SenC/PrrC family)
LNEPHSGVSGGEVPADARGSLIAVALPSAQGVARDPYFDTPSILKKYGKLYGVRFNNNTKFLKAVDCADAVLHDELQLRVSYGAGSVNQHGVQLFVFDKLGRLAAIDDNEVWSVSEVESCLLALLNE